ncbi:type II toxin-antitoxin system HipA family toxin [Bordetella muralis]|uniref:type II toxin-antitoxin system HipA family toxin n=1 Tax=Bordetella muralis TaxID=1649130 RepID=UPI0039F0E5B8
MHDISFLTVLLYGQPIGTLSHVGHDQTLFSFNESYIHDSNRPTLGLRFKDAFDQLLIDFKPHRMKLMPFFSNLLPEGPLRRYLASSVGVHAEREFSLLWALGQDLPGAITVVPSDTQPWPTEATTLPSRTPRQSTEDHALHFSLAGVQLKFSAMMNVRGGMTIPAHGVGGHWIVKLPSREFSHVPENEFSMMTLAKSIGINVPDIDLVDVRAIDNLPRGIERLEGKAFVIRRFDRKEDNGAVHIEDFAQVFDVYPTEKYSKANYRNLATVIAAESGLEDIAELIRRITFNVLIGNGDMHLKNWSLIYPDRRHARLSPAYDFVSTIAYIPGDRSALKFSRTKEFSGYTIDELNHFVAKAALPRKLVLDVVQETIALFTEHWGKEKKHLPMDQHVRTTIDTHLAALPILSTAI